VPEGAEVKIIAEGVAKQVGNNRLLSVTSLSGRYAKSEIEGLATLSLPLKILGVGARGKLVFWILDNENFLLNTLGMTGGWTSTPTKYSRVRFDIENAGSIFFNDTRNFGTLKFVKGKSKFVSKLQTLGPDMLSDNVSYEQFQERMTLLPKGTTLTEALMNQSVISGVGNYVKAEALWRARLSPHRETISVSISDLELLCDAIKSTLHEAYEAGGASLKDYLNAEGERGQAQQNFAVYGKKKDPMGNPVVKEQTKDGRMTHWAPAWQK